MEEKLRSLIYVHAKKWVLEAGENIRQLMYDDLQIEAKSNPNDLVTSLDKQTERYLIHHIRNNYPSHFIMGEEGYGDQIESLDGTIWIIDPIDGTMNFVHQKKNFSISVGIYHNGIGEIGLVYDVMNDVLYHSKRGNGVYRNNHLLPPLKKSVVLEESLVSMNHYWLCPNDLVDVEKMQQFVGKIRGSRTIGSAALELAHVAEGSTDGYLSLSLMPWDIAAGMVLVNEVGGTVTNAKGKKLSLLEKDSLLACNKVIQREIGRAHV